MHEKIEESWREKLAPEFKKDYFKNLTHLVKEAYRTKTCFPPEELIFSAFEHTPFDTVKVVIIGQDPYHGKGQANGLCFSFIRQKETDKLPPSLKMIFKEINLDLGTEVPEDGNLQRWAEQGVLLLNATLTVREKEANSHKKYGWGIFTDAVIKKIAEEKEGVVFLLWGLFAQSKRALIDENKHYVLQSGHPAPPGCYRNWFGNKHFSKTNKYLEEKGELGINW